MGICPLLPAVAAVRGATEGTAARTPCLRATSELRERAMSQAPIDGYRARECFVGAARKASRRLTQFYDDALAPCGLKSTQYSIFSELTRFTGPPTLAELASALVSDRSAVGHNLRPLIRDGYLALEPGAEDRRER